VSATTGQGSTASGKPFRYTSFVAATVSAASIMQLLAEPACQLKVKVWPLTQPLSYINM
jgi:hypothetical protein